MTFGHIHWLVSGFDSERDISRANLASLRLRASVAIKALKRSNVKVSSGDRIPDQVDAVIVTKIGSYDIKKRAEQWLSSVSVAKAKGAMIFVDYTDHHLAYLSPMTSFYQQLLEYCDGFVVPSEAMRENILRFWSGPVTLIPDAVEYGLLAPKHKSRDRSVPLWFGHPSNLKFLIGFLQSSSLSDLITDLVVCTDVNSVQWLQKNIFIFGSLRVTLVPWSVAIVPQLARKCDIALLPAGNSDPRKSGASANRLITGLALGLPVLTNSLLSYLPYRRFYADIDRDDYEHVIRDPTVHHRLVLQAQRSVVLEFTPVKIGRLWQNFLGVTCPVTSSRELDVSDFENPAG
jgi:hypothetical protein